MLQVHVDYVLYICAWNVLATTFSPIYNECNGTIKPNIIAMYVHWVCWCLFVHIRSLFMHCRVDQRQIYISNLKTKCSQSSSSIHEKLLMEWLIHNWQWLQWQANSNLDSNDGLRIGHTNDWMNNQVCANKQRLSESLLAATTYRNYS